MLWELLEFGALLYVIARTLILVGIVLVGIVVWLTIQGIAGNHGPKTP